MVALTEKDVKCFQHVKINKIYTKYLCVLLYLTGMTQKEVGFFLYNTRA